MGARCIPQAEVASRATKHDSHVTPVGSLEADGTRIKFYEHNEAFSSAIQNNLSTAHSRNSGKQNPGRLVGDNGNRSRLISWLH